MSFTVAEKVVQQQPEQNDQIQSEPIEQPKKSVPTAAIVGGGAGVLALGGIGAGAAIRKGRRKREIS